jgi:hypothetical protein
MLLITPENIRWRRWSYCLLILLMGFYFFFAFGSRFHGGSPQGLAYGTLGLALVLILMFFGVRKRSYRSSWGSVENWLHAHIYLGLIAVVTILLHSGFHFHDKIAVAAFVLLTLVALSGLWGAFIYTVVPPKMTSVASNLSAAEMSDQLNELGGSMARLATGKSESFQLICAGFLQAERPVCLAGWRILSRRFLQKRLAQDPSGSFDSYLGRVPEREQADLAQLLALAHQRNDLHDRLIHRQRYVNLLSAWLFLHVPLSFAMILAVAAHIVAFFYYG